MFSFSPSFFKAAILFLWTKRGLFCMVMKGSCWRPQLLQWTQSQQLFGDGKFNFLLHFFFRFMFFFPPFPKPLQIFRCNHRLWFHFSLHKQQAVQLRALRDESWCIRAGIKKKKKKGDYFFLFPLSFQIPAGCDRVVNTQDKRRLCLLLLNIPIRLPTMTAFVCSHVQIRVKFFFASSTLPNIIQS